MDLWSTLFQRKDKLFPDDQVLYTSLSPTLKSHTYFSLKRQTISFGHGFRQHHAFRKGDVLALFSENNINTPITMWGTHYAGGVVSSANQTYSKGELVHHLRDSGARTVVTKKEELGKVREAVKELETEGTEKRNVEVLVQVANLMQVALREGKIVRWDRDRILSVLPFFHVYCL
ncbi:hypothetical protein DID88_007570 [Monilinia fructigena]|uniref:AMP-dependent synthetase/ligase domain-containing protein n=1 Tax=Monilinia fructigena TaxID=38457 RepID=A0A395J2P2_9HELO|nr:hypothetical protein DID88_007570 [Monilinia fructigena]